MRQDLQPHLSFIQSYDPELIRSNNAKNAIITTDTANSGSYIINRIRKKSLR
jgi:hypothetical protein